MRSSSTIRKTNSAAESITISPTVESANQALASTAESLATGFWLNGVWSRSREYLADLASLTKPRILVLLLITTCCPMVLAAKGQVDGMLVFYALLGGALMSGSAGAFNCIWDRDVDTVMQRTKDRPLPNNRLTVTAAFVFATLLGIAGFTVLIQAVNEAAAFLSLFGHLFYVFVYTIWLKRRTPQNIVIGGAAGAVPPMVGWVAVTGKIDLDAVLLFLVIFLWTPPHFWALALNRNKDYQRAGIPMLPVVAGQNATHKQMLWYALALLPVTLALVLHNETLGVVSLVGLLSLSAMFAWKVQVLKRTLKIQPELHDKQAWDVFKFSVLYLALFFAFLVIDSVLI